MSSAEWITRFRGAIAELQDIVECDKLADKNVEAELRAWLDAGAQPLSWTHTKQITPDEWFFVTTLYGEMTRDGQRTHIRKYFAPLLISAAKRDIRNFVPDMPEYAGLRANWMPQRLARMGGILRERGLTMREYAQHLQMLERAATPDNPMPALDAIIRDHKATGWKTLSVFARDCVGANCFPIDSRVEKELRRHDLPINERQLVSLALAVGCNPRLAARMFYEAGGQRSEAQAASKQE